jgi:hypothetical protein
MNAELRAVKTYFNVLSSHLSVTPLCCQRKVRPLSVTLTFPVTVGINECAREVYHSLQLPFLIIHLLRSIGMIATPFANSLRSYINPITYTKQNRSKCEHMRY